jgi:hypothetical protein
MPDNDTIESSASDFGTPFRALLDHCENKGLKFRANQKKKRIKLTLCRRHALYNCNLQITHKDSGPRHGRSRGDLIPITAMTVGDKHPEVRGKRQRR